MNIRLLTLSTACIVSVLTGCVERRVVYVPAQPQPAYAPAPPPPQPGAVAVPAAPPTDAQAPAPAPAVAAPVTPPPAPVAPPPGAYVAYAPDYYTWDGYEYVGVVNGQYVYWSGGIWVMAPPGIVLRFHGWERFHPDWRRRAIPYRRWR